MLLGSSDTFNGASIGTSTGYCTDPTTTGTSTVGTSDNIDKVGLFDDGSNVGRDGCSTGTFTGIPTDPVSSATFRVLSLSTICDTVVGVSGC